MGFIYTIMGSFVVFLMLSTPSMGFVVAGDLITATWSINFQLPQWDSGHTIDIALDAPKDFQLPQWDSWNRRLGDSGHDGAFNSLNGIHRTATSMTAFLFYPFNSLNGIRENAEVEILVDGLSTPSMGF